MMSLTGPLALMVSALPVSPATASDWKSFQPPKQAFSIRMPAEIVKSKHATRTMAGLIETIVWEAKLEATHLSVSITDLPDIANAFTSNDTIYTKTRENLMKELGAALSSVEKLAQGPFGQKLAYRIPAKDGAPSKIGRALISVRKGTIVVINAMVAPSASLTLDELFSGLTTDATPRIARAW